MAVSRRTRLFVLLVLVHGGHPEDGIALNKDNPFWSDKPELIPEHKLQVCAAKNDPARLAVHVEYPLTAHSECACPRACGAQPDNSRKAMASPDNPRDQDDVYRFSLSGDRSLPRQY